MIYPCFQCQRRVLGCHATCAEYQKTASGQLEIAKRKKEDFQLKRFADDVHFAGKAYDRQLRQNERRRS